MADIGFLDAMILGIVEGLTEFIPVSSTGHLILAADLLGAHSEKTKVFEICIQFGAILAVALIYFKRLFSLLNFSDNKGFSGFRGLSCLFLGCLPALTLGAIFSSKIKALLFYPLPVGIALVIGAILMIVVERRQTEVKFKSLDQVDPKTCLYVGMVQALSLWPGMSRAATSIIGGMAFGFDRKVAAEFSFLMAVPLIGAATLHDLYENFSLLSRDDLSVFCLGAIVAFLSALLAVKGFISLLSKFPLAPFAYYRLLVGALVIIFYL